MKHEIDLFIFSKSFIFDFTTKPLN